MRARRRRRGEEELATEPNEFCFRLQHHSPEVGWDEAEAHAKKNREERERQCNVFQKFAGHSTKLPKPIRAVDGRVRRRGQFFNAPFFTRVRTRNSHSTVIRMAAKAPNRPKRSGLSGNGKKVP